MKQKNSIENLFEIVILIDYLYYKELVLAVLSFYKLLCFQHFYKCFDSTFTNVSIATGIAVPLICNVSSGYHYCEVYGSGCYIMSKVIDHDRWGSYRLILNLWKLGTDLTFSWLGTLLSLLLLGSLARCRRVGDCRFGAVQYSLWSRLGMGIWAFPRSTDVVLGSAVSSWSWSCPVSRSSAYLVMEVGHCIIGRSWQPSSAP